MSTPCRPIDIQVVNEVVNPALNNGSLCEMKSTLDEQKFLINLLEKNSKTLIPGAPKKNVTASFLVPLLNEGKDKIEKFPKNEKNCAVCGKGG
eukprot:Pgem_evm1s17980